MGRLTIFFVLLHYCLIITANTITASAISKVREKVLLNVEMISKKKTVGIKLSDYNEVIAVWE